MGTVTIQRPVVDLKATGAQIKSLRIKSGYTVHSSSFDSFERYLK